MPFFEKIKFKIFSRVNYHSLNFRGTAKTKKKKKARDIYKKTLDIEFERDRLIALGSMIGDGQTDRQTDTDTHTHTHTHIFSKTHF